MSSGFSKTIFLPDEAATAALGQKVAPYLSAGDTLLLSGQIGAGKSHFARSIIRRLVGETEDIPSPTYTLVQTYQAADFEIWHADLYRMSDFSELAELGLEDAFDRQVAIIEWADRLGADAPLNALLIAISDENEGRRFEMNSQDAKWLKLNGVKYE